MKQEKYEDTKLYVKVNREEIEQYLKNSHSGINAIIDGNTNGIHFYLMSDKDLSDHDKELVAKVLESVKNEAYKDGFYDEDGNKIITYHINNYILDQIQKEF